MQKITKRNIGTFSIAAPAIAALTATVVLAGCGKGSDLAAQIDKLNIEAQSRNTWVSECLPSTNEGQALGYPKQIVTLDIGDSLQKTTTVYSTDNCAPGTDEIQITENGGKQITERVSDNTSKFNVQYNSSAVMPLKTDAADKLNLANACGTRAWVLKGQIVVTGKKPADACWDETPRAEFDLIQIRDSQLFLGLLRGTQDKKSEEGRPTEVDSSGFHKK